MNLLAAVNYDPTGGAAVSKATTALLAMTALDTTNLRVTFTVPLSGRVWVRVSGGGLHGAATYPVILVGILSGAAVVARHQPIVTIGGTAAATTPGQVFCEFTVPGLTPGTATTWDLAYGVEQLVALTGWKYGGPNNNTTAGDAFGGISFEVYDPNPIYLPGVMPTATVQANEATVIANQGTLATSVAAVKTKTDSLTFTTALKVDAAMNIAADFPQAAADKVWATTTRALTDKVGFALSSAGVQAIWDALTAALTTVGSIGKRISDNLDVVLSTRGTSSYAGGAVASVTGAVGSVTGNVGGNVVGAVASVTGSVGSVASYGTLVADVATAVWGAVTRTLTASLDPTASAIADAVWNRLTSAITTVSSIGKLLVDNVNATISSRSTYAGGDTSGTTTLLTRVPGVVPVASDYTSARAAKLDNLSGDAFARLGAPAGASVSADVAAVKVDTASAVTRTTDIQSRLPAALTGGKMESNVGAMSSSVLTAAALATDAALEISATVWDEALAGHTTAGTAGKTLTTAGGAAAPSAATVAAAVWDEALAGHATVGTAGKTLSSAGSAGDPWGTLLPGAYAAGTAGKIVGDRLDAVVSTRAASADLDTRADAIDAAIGTTGSGSVTDDIQSIQGAISPPSRRRITET